jgi:peptide/nickel transport system substrate-binding protein
MLENIFHMAQRFIPILGLILCAGFAAAEPKHGISMYGEPALPPDFVSLPYANPDAPKGGAIVLGNTRGFDSLNPFVRKGRVPWQLRFLTHEALMGRSWDEPFTLYGLLAESIEVPEDRSWVEFTLRESARFSDGSPVTVADVMFSYELLGTQGSARYRSFYDQVAEIKQTGLRSLRISFNTDNRELALLAGMRPILSKAQWQGKDFANSPLSEIPIGTGPYTVTDYEAGRFVTLTRNPDYWGADVPIQQGLHNFDQIKLDFYGDASVMFEGFKAGELTSLREGNVEAWNTRYNFPAITSGDVVKSVFPHQKPSGITGFVMNTRRAPFQDWQVRQALIEAFNFEYINEAVTGAAQPRITSFFSNSPLAMRPGPAPKEVADLLAPYADILPPDTLEGYVLPVADGSTRNRAGIRAAIKQFEAAGFSAADGVMRDPNGMPLAFNILLPQNSTQDTAVAEIYIQALQRLGIDVQVETIDDAQFISRVNSFDFDMTIHRRAASLSPGNEQHNNWGSKAADIEGSRNLMGAKSPAIDAMIDAMLRSQDRQAFTDATRALDRLLTAGRYVIPFWQFTEGRIAHVKELRYPDYIPLYGDGPEYMPHVWWYQP